MVILDETRPVEPSRRLALSPAASGSRSSAQTARLHPRRETYAARLERFADRPALITQDGEHISYRELATRADAFAARLGDGRRLLMIEAANEAEPLIAYLGALRAGHPVLLMPAGSAEARARVRQAYRPDARLSKDQTGWTLHLETSSHARALHPDLALLLSTSGSTGAIKFVRLSHAAMDANARAIAEYLDIGSDDRAISSLPFHYSYGLSVIASHLHAGATVILTDQSVIEPKFWDLFVREGANSLAGVPHTFELLDRAGFRDMPLPTIRTITQAGGRLSPDNVRRYAEWARARGVRFFVMYGQTEATARMAYLAPELVCDAPDAIGVPIPGGQFRLVDSNGRAIEKPDCPGELVYSGPNVMMGYAVSEADLAEGPELAELHTGDLAARDSRGIYRIVGRKSRFTKLFGLRISLDEIEAALSRRGLRAAAAGDDAVIAVALLSGDPPESLAEELAAEWKIPSSAIDLRAWRELPLLPSGKTDYQAILRTAQEKRQAGFSKPAMPPRLAMERAFQRIFPRQSPAPEDSFVSLGGDSLNYVLLSMEIEQQLGFLPERWEELSIARLQSLATAPPKARGWWAPRAIEPEMVVRALAIITVVIQHSGAGWVVAGGAEVLLMLAGYNLARYQRQRLFDANFWAVARPFLARIMLPYYLVLVAYLIYRHQFDIASLLLVSNFFGRFASLMEPYWFLEALFQAILVTLALFALKPVRLAARRDPWHFGLVLLGVSLAVKMTLFVIFHRDGLQNRTPDQVYYLFALGWCVLHASTPARRLFLTAIALLIAALDLNGGGGTWFTYAYPSDFSHVAWLLAAILPILWLPRVTLPGLAYVAVTTLAAASFYVYLTHGIPIYILIRVLNLHSVALCLLASVAIGIATWKLAQINLTRWGPRLRSLVGDRKFGAALRSS